LIEIGFFGFPGPIAVGRETVLFFPTTSHDSGRCVSIDIKQQEKGKTVAQQ